MGVLGVEEHLQLLVAVNVAGALGNDLSGIDDVLKDSLVDSG